MRRASLGGEVRRREVTAGWILRDVVCVSVYSIVFLIVVYHWGYPLGAVELKGGPGLQEFV